MAASEAIPFYIFLLFDALQYEINLKLLLIGVCPETQLRGDEMGSDLPNPTPPFFGFTKTPATNNTMSRSAIAK
jgi:hypothetical protein